MEKKKYLSPNFYDAGITAKDVLTDSYEWGEDGAVVEDPYK